VNRRILQNRTILPVDPDELAHGFFWMVEERSCLSGISDRMPRALRLRRKRVGIVEKNGRL